jgi:hypothetical protein
MSDLPTDPATRLYAPARLRLGETSLLKEFGGGMLRRLRKLTLLSLNRVTHTQNRIQKALRQLVIIRAAGACC